MVRFMNRAIALAAPLAAATGRVDPLEVARSLIVAEKHEGVQAASSTMLGQNMTQMSQ
jgi:hypothetical protein